VSFNYFAVWQVAHDTHNERIREAKRQRIWEKAVKASRRRSK
jgi:hypothetical protein